uniref:ParB/RepB/Spo0J family partition protein n=1 Tax=Desulfovirgula thermocuniculi TaxID=348842 RepID=UPI0006854AFD
FAVRSEVPIELLKPHPKNEFYHSWPSKEKYEEIKRSIAAEGIRDPLKVTPDYTVIAGHLRLEIAKELGFTHVPVQIVGGDSEYLEYLLIADNDERRDTDDPIRKARRAEFLRRYWGVREGSANPKGTVVYREGQNVPHGATAYREDQNDPHERKTLADVARAIKEDLRTTKRLLKLNDLIPALQDLVSQGRLSQTAAYSLAFLPPEEQEELLRVLGEAGLAGLSVKEAQELRRELEAVRREKEDLARRLAGLEAKEGELERLKARLKELEERPVERVVEKVVYRPDPVLEAELEAARTEAAKLLQEKERIECRLHDVIREKERKEAKIRTLEEEVEKLRRWLDHARSELKKERERPKPPQWSKEHQEFRALMDKANEHAAGLATALKDIKEKHAGRLLSVARVRGTPGDDIEGISEVTFDVLVYTTFRTCLDLAASWIAEIWDVLEPGKPKLKLVKKD